MEQAGRVSDTATKLRTQLLANGYTPLANLDKRCLLPGWPTLEVDDAMIRRWGRSRKYRGTGLRLDNELAMIDADVDHTADTMMALEQAMVDAVPKLSDALMRFGKGNKFALFCRVDEPFNRIQSHSFTAPGETEDDGAHRIEIFGGSTARQAGSFGPHSLNEAGETLIEYEWADDRSPATVPLEELPVLTKKEFFAAVAAAQAWLVANGFAQVKMSAQGENVERRVYDLTDEMEFECNDGVTRSLSELEQIAEKKDMRCSASWLEPGAQNPTRCLISRTKTGILSIYETATGITHFPKRCKPQDYEETRQEFAGRLTALDPRKKFSAHTPDIEETGVPDETSIERTKESRQSTAAARTADHGRIRYLQSLYRIQADDEPRKAAEKMLHLYAYLPTSNTPIVPILSAAGEDGAMTYPNFRNKYAANRRRLREIDPNSNSEKTVSASEMWLVDSRRITVAGVRMRPEMPAPLYEEDGSTWINTYRAPELGDAASGSADEGIAFLKHLIPDPNDRAWFTQWLAYKFRHPHIPGPAVVMVARRQGTGRGTLGEIIKLLFGEQYVRNVPFKIFAGQDGQSVFTDWGAGVLFALADESSNSQAGLPEHQQKHGSYEHLKEIVDPRPKMRMFVGKYKRSFHALSYTTYLIATNNIDALPIPPGDRRFAVLLNGGTNTPEYWAKINRWMGDKNNIAAFAAWLEQVSLEGYDPYMAPATTEAKQDMIELGRSPVETALEMAIKRMPQRVFTEEQLLNEMDEIRHDEKLNFGAGGSYAWTSVARRVIRRRCYRVGKKDGKNGYIQIGGKRHIVYADNEDLAAYWKTRDGLREEVLRNDKSAAERSTRGALRLVHN